MGIIESLDAYMASQKTVAINFIALGVLFFLIAGALFAGERWGFDPSTKLLQGLKTGTLVWGLVILAGGGAYYNFCNKTYDQLVNTYETDKSEYLIEEHQRISKVVKDYPGYQMVFAAFIIISLVFILFVDKAFLSGIAFSTMLLFAVLMLFEAHSKTSIDHYFKQIQTFSAGDNG